MHELGSVRRNVRLYNVFGSGRVIDSISIRCSAARMTHRYGPACIYARTGDARGYIENFGKRRLSPAIWYFPATSRALSGAEPIFISSVPGALNEGKGKEKYISVADWQTMTISHSFARSRSRARVRLLYHTQVITQSRITCIWTGICIIADDYEACEISECAIGVSERRNDKRPRRMQTPGAPVPPSPLDYLSRDIGWRNGAPTNSTRTVASERRYCNSISRCSATSQ